MLSKIIRRFFDIITTDHDEAIKQVALIQITVLTLVFGLLHSIILMFFLGMWDLSDIILIYVVGSFLNLATYKMYKNYNFFRVLQLVFIVFMPVFTQLYIGGFIASSAVGISAFLAPLGAMFFYSTKVSRVFFFIFLLFMAIAGFMESEHMLKQSYLSTEITIFLFFIVISLTFSVIYFTTEYVFDQKNKEIEGLRKEITALKSTNKKEI